MKTLTPLFLVTLLGCAHNTAFRPRHAARLIGEEAMQCDDVEVSQVRHASYEIDPVYSGGLAVVAWGCGKLVRLRCDPYGTRNGTCVDDRSYATPGEEELQGIVKIRTTYRNADGVTQRERIQIGDQYIVRTPNSLGRALGLPVRAGRTRWRLESSPVYERTSLGAYASAYSVRTYTRVTRHTGQGCGREFAFDVAAGAVYRVELEYGGANQCEVRCAQEIETPAGIALTQCPGFERL